TGVERGQYAEALGREEEWIKERLQAHRSADGTIEERLGNGRWLKIAERRMPNGDIVGFRVNITRYKTAEEALKKAHDDLERKVEMRTAELKESNDRLLVEVEAHKKTEKALKQQNEYLSALHDMSIGMFGRMALSELLENIVKRAAKLTGIPNGFLHLYDPETDELVIHAGSGDYSGQIGYRLSAGTGLAGAVWQTGKPIILADYAAWPGRLGDSLFDNSHSMIGIPLPAGCGTDGVIGLSFPDKENKIDESLIPVLEQFAEIASLAIYNASLFEKIEDGLTKQIEIEKERREMEKKLFQSQKMESIGTLAGGIAHDFNNILSAIIGYTELALDEVEPGSGIGDYLPEVYTAGKRARDLVKQILTFARKSEEELKIIRVNTIAREVLKFIRSTIPTTIQISKSIESNSQIKGNATQVHQVLMNLCTNAAHAMEQEGGVLALSIRDVFIPERITHRNMVLTPGHYMEIRISDTGEGISPDIIDAIFEPYFTTKDPGEGTGMGLAVVHGIVDSYGGKITVDSELNKGTVFTIYLPIIQKHKEDVPHPSETLPRGTERVLLVDDEVTIVELGREILERLGYLVTTRTSSLEALERFRSGPDDFDLVITDMTMPNMTGDRLATEMMAIRKDVPVILCTGYSKKISAERVSEIGIKALVYKPLVRANLSKTVRKVLDEAKGIPHDK
ncbi:MAG: response regulator, partial [Deltaproteobacteria bacterium]|nr:response regulator [Deltaproteobacteria bacterium]